MEALLPSLHRQLQALLAKVGVPHHVTGVCPGARVLGVELVLAQAKRALVVVPNPEDAEELAAAYQLLFPHLQAAVLPAEAFCPYSPEGTPLGSTAEAVAALLAWEAGELARLVIPARALAMPLPAPESLRRRCLSLAPGQVVDLRQLAQLLAEEGFRRVEVVEEAGEFALRGEVLDVGTAEGFFRLVADVDRVEHLRLFDPQTQRSTQEVNQLLIRPLTLFPRHAQAQQQLAAWAVAKGWPELAARAESYDPRAEPFLALVSPRLAPWELEEALAVVEPEAVRGELARSWLSWQRLHQAQTRELSCPPPEQWLAPPEACLQALEAKPTVQELATSKGALHLATAPTPAFASHALLLVEELRRGLGLRQTQVLVAASSGEQERLAHLLRDHELPFRLGAPEEGGIGLVLGQVGRGFAWPQAQVVVFGRRELTHMPAAPSRRRTLAQVLFDLRDLAVGDYVVHADHGIGRFVGFRTVQLDGHSHDCLELEYAGGARLLVPMERADLLQKYAAAEAAPPRLDRLGGSSWRATKARVKAALKDLAEELLATAARRQLTPGHAFSKDGPWQKEFEAAFEWELTPDQEQAVAEIKQDMESPRPMDRLLVGDVGYGKTEVAMRAAFKAVMDGKQVALLAPTTVLVEQHYRTFTRRFAGFPVEIRMFSRFLPAPAQREIVRGVAEGTVDIVIGTHRLLASDVRFRDLGLLIIDEEQRFGVAQKEKLKKLKANVDVLSMSATPIPRTLNLGLLGLRDVSIIETPPRDRLAVQTHVVPYNPEIIHEAVNRELARGGQVFFVHNRVATLPAMAKLLRKLVPEARLVVAHGQMGERELARAMEAFFDHKADVLLATAIVENGLDVPNANTLIVNRADLFGLAQLYQLRGRVGRSDRLAFAYLLVPNDENLSPEARSRLAAILEFAELGAGFRVAARDLEIRGAGNILGAQQHGHLRAVGYETYCRLLEEAVAELKGQPLPEPAPAADVQLGLPLRVPESYIPQETLRLSLYRRLAAAQSEEELARVLEEAADRFGPPPPELQNLSLVQRVRLAAQHWGVRKLRRHASGLDLQLDPAHPQAHTLAVRIATRFAQAKLSPSGTVHIPEPVPVDELELLLQAC